MKNCGAIFEVLICYLKLYLYFSNYVFSISVLNQHGDQRPNCLIIDEIDGSSAPVINFLVDIITGKDRQSNKGKFLAIDIA